MLGGALLLVGGGVSLALRSGADAPGAGAPKTLKVLTAYEHAIVSAVAARLVPGDGAGPDGPTAQAAGVPEKVDALLATMHPRVTKELRQLLHLFENALTGLVSAGVATTFSRSSPAEQDRRLEAWRLSRLALCRTGYQAMKRLAHATYYSTPAVYPRLGYPGPPAVPQGPA